MAIQKNNSTLKILDTIGSDGCDGSLRDEFYRRKNTILVILLNIVY